MTKSKQAYPTDLNDTEWVQIAPYLPEPKSSSVEADNAELRHYLARLARRSRYFSRHPYTLKCALRLFVFAFNSRQLHKQRFPNYAAHLMDFLSPRFLTSRA